MVPCSRPRAPANSHSNYPRRSWFQFHCRRTPLAVRAAEQAAQTDDYYMGLALQQAAQAFDAEEVPIGAVLVSGMEVISVAHNQIEHRHNPLCHAELLCIMSAAEQLQAWRLQDATLYSTLEPCPMCAGAILQARLKRLVYGAKQPRIGADGSWVAMFPPREHQEQQQLSSTGTSKPSYTEARHADIPASQTPPADTAPEPEQTRPGEQQSQQQQHQQHGQGGVPDCIQPNGNHPFHTKIIVTSGVRQDECRSIMQLFFRRRRQQQQQEEKAKRAAEMQQ